MSDVLDRLLSHLRKIIRDEDPNRDLVGLFEYSVSSAQQTASDVVFSGYPTDVRPTPDDTNELRVPLPPAVNWPLRVGIAGTSFVPAVGGLVYVMFANRDPAKPVVVSYDGTVPLLVQVSGGVLPSARVTDTVQAGPFSGTITSGSLKVYVG